MIHTPAFSLFTERLLAFLRSSARTPPTDDQEFNRLALELFRLQAEHVAPYRRLCHKRGIIPEQVNDWRQIPPIPTSAFKEFDFTSLPSSQRTRVFFSSGTTGQARSRHFHCAESLAIYDASLKPWFETHVLPRGVAGNLTGLSSDASEPRLIILTPPPASAPNSSLVHMFETIRQAFCPNGRFFASTTIEEAWSLDFEALQQELNLALAQAQPVLLLGTAFSYVHLLDELTSKKTRLQLPAGSRALETGGYKGRSRIVEKSELRRLICHWLGIPLANIISEYGMSELSSQAYDRIAGNDAAQAGAFAFPPWARVRILSPETNQDVSEGETGLIQVHDLANVFSLAAVQTEDLARRRGAGFEWIGRVQNTQARGCSLMAS